MGRQVPFSKYHLGSLEIMLEWLNDPRNRDAPLASLPDPIFSALRILPTWSESAENPDRSKTGQPWVEQVLAYPNRRLIVYGTLAPGETHHDQVASFGDDWQRAWIRGEKFEYRGYPVFRSRREGQKIRVQLLQSDRIDWTALDAFEGEAYRRIWIPAETESGILVGNIYAFRE